MSKHVDDRWPRWWLWDYRWRNVADCDRVIDDCGSHGPFLGCPRHDPGNYNGRHRAIGPAE